MWLLRPPKSRWRWHVLTWLAAVPALGFVALVQVAGEYSYDELLLESQPRWYYLPHPEASFPRDQTGDPPDFDADIDAQFQGLPELVSERDHGWPIPWLRSARWRDYSSAESTYWYFHGHWIEWSNLDNWPFSADAWRFAPFGLVVNLCIAMCVVAVPMLGTETWLRRRGGPGRFKISDFLVVVLLAAAGLGFWRWDRSETSREARIAYQIEYFERKGSVSQGYVGPEWIERLAGNSDLVPFLHRYNSLWVKGNEMADLDYESLAKLQSLRSVTLNFGEILIRTDVRSDSEPAEREDLQMGTPEPISLAALSKLPQIRELWLNNWSEGALSVEFRPEELRALTQIKSVRMDEMEGDLKTVLALRHLPHLEELHLRTDWYFDDELALLKSTFAGVKINPIGDPRRPPYRDQQITVRRWGDECELSNDARTLKLTADPAFPAERFKEIESILPRLKTSSSTPATSIRIPASHLLK